MVLKNEQLLTADEVCEITTLSRQTLWRHTRAGKFPARSSLAIGSSAGELPTSSDSSRPGATWER